MDNLVKRLMSS